MVLPWVFFLLPTTGEELSSYNYPYYTPGSVTSNGTTTPIPFKSETLQTGETLTPVAFENQIAEGTPRTLHELMSDTTNIQCPTGKTAKIVLFLQPRFSSMVINIRSSTTADTANGTILKALTINDVDDFITIDGISLLSDGFLTIEVASDVGETVDVEGGAIIVSA